MTKKILAALLALMLLICVSPISAIAETGTYSWTGVWETNWGEMTLTQTGDKVSGTYTYDGGKISGTVSGDTLTGRGLSLPPMPRPMTRER